MSRTFAVVLALSLLIFGICLLRYAPPTLRDAQIPADQFSGARAQEVQKVISGGGSRVIGSDANAAARTFLVAELNKAGWKTELQSATSCSRHGACGAVKNIVATRRGSDPGATAVLLMAHYDSVTCSPGATDDGFGTSAVIESARALASGPPLRRNLIIVLTDGEEAGLLGAEAFAQQHPLARTVAGVVNVDSRGSRGPSAMFETSAGNGWIIGVLARSVDRPVTSSLFYEIYRRMPNDTDFTAIKGQAQGVNFANIAGVERYHTSLDSFANADPGTLQHHGDQALAMTRALAAAGPELDAPRQVANDAVWFDVLATFIVRWPTAVALGLALTAFGLVLGWTIRLRAWREGLRGFAAPLAALSAALLGAISMGGGLQALGALPVPWIAHPMPALLAMHGTCIFAGLVAARLVAGRASVTAVWAGTWLTWGGLGVLLAMVAPGASFLFVVPTLAAGLFGWLRTDIAAALPALVAAVLWLPIALLVYAGLGVVVPVVTCISSVVLVSAWPALWLRGPALDGADEARVLRRRVAAGAGALVVVLAVVALLVPRYSTDIPQRVNVVFRQDAAQPARVHVEAAWAYVPWGKPPPAMVRALAADPSRVVTATAWGMSSPVPMAEVPRVDLAAPSASVVTSQDTPSGSTLIRLVSRRGARTFVIELPPNVVVALSVDGQKAVPRRGTVVLRGVPAAGVEVLVTPVEVRPLTLTVLDVTPGVPEASAVARAVADARPAEAVPTQDGDLTMVGTILEL